MLTLFKFIMHSVYSLYCFCIFIVFIYVDRDKAPGQRECDCSIDNINKCIRDIEQASLAAVGQTLPCRDDISMEVSSSTPSALSCLRELNGICSLSIVTYTVILYYCNSLGTPGAANILCAGDRASDRSCLHHSSRRSCPTRTQGAGLIIYLDPLWV